MSLDAQTFNKLVQDPSSISRENLDELEEMAEQYPYSNVLFILLYRGYALHYPEEEDAYLGSAALYSGSPETVNKYLGFKEQKDEDDAYTDNNMPGKAGSSKENSEKTPPAPQTETKQPEHKEQQKEQDSELKKDEESSNTAVNGASGASSQDSSTTTSASGQIFTRLSEEDNQRILEEIESNLRQLQQYKKAFHDQETEKTNKASSGKRGRPPKSNTTQSSTPQKPKGSSTASATKKTSTSSKSSTGKSTSKSKTTTSSASGSGNHKTADPTTKEASTTKRKPGRPAGSKNKTSGTTATKSSSAQKTTNKAKTSSTGSSSGKSKQKSESKESDSKKNPEKVKGDAFDEINEKVLSSGKSSSTDKKQQGNTKNNDLLLNYLTSVNPEKYGHGENKNHQEDLIDRFIQLEPSISKPSEKDVKEENKRDLASESHENKWEIASENLAQIYASQGKKDRAIETYEKLILKYPEKKAYFASCIDELKKH